MKKTITTALVLIVILGLAVLGYWWYGKTHEETIAANTQSVSATSTQSSPTTSTQPSITLLSPNGGETITEGSVYTVRWSSRNLPADSKIAINIRRVPPPPLPTEGQEFDPLVFTNLPNTGSTTWTVADMYPEGNYILGITGYVSTPVTNPVTDESNAPFRIVKSAGQTYTNAKFGYSIAYPNDWTYREFPSTQSGAGFRPTSSPNEVSSECINVDERSAPGSVADTPFVDYVKTAAVNEIQGFEKLNSIATTTTSGGLVGYETTWIYRDMTGQEKVSLPITYFENEKTVTTGGNQLEYKTVQITLNNKDCQDVYDQMLPTFKLK